MVVNDWKQVGRNEPCPCGSGKKYKHCHMRSDREEAQQAEIEAAKRAEEERLAQIRERAQARQEESNASPSLDEFDDDDRVFDNEIFNALFEAFEDADADGKWDICRSAIDEQLMDGEMVFEFFLELHRDALQRGLESRFVQLVRHLHSECPDVYQNEISDLFGWTFPLLSPSDRDEFLPDFIEDLIAHGPRDISPFLNNVDMLAALGESSLFNRVVRSTQEAIQEADLFEWATDHFRGTYLDTFLFEAVDKMSADERQEQERISALFAVHPHPDELQEEHFTAYAGRLAGKRSSWKPDDFAVHTSGRKADRIPDTTLEHLTDLCQEFLAHLRWEKRVPFVKGQLGKAELWRFLANQEISSPRKKTRGKSRRKALDGPLPPAVLPLAPDREQLDEYLYGLMTFMSFQPYKGIVLLELIPAWLEFLEENNLIGSEERAASLRSLRDLAEAVQKYSENETLAPQLRENLALAWATPVEKEL